jgi:methylmalonyl-CoA/ethylmalonyl-CoA epimerase
MGKLHHVGIAVRNLDEALARLQVVLGDCPITREEVASQKIRVAELDLGNVKLELLEPTAEDSPVEKFLRKRGEGLHHLSFATTDVAGDLGRLKEAGVALVDKTPRLGAEGNHIAFVHPRSMGGVLIELCQEP